MKLQSSRRSNAVRTIKRKGRTIHYLDGLGLYHSLQEIFVEKVYDFVADDVRPVIIDCGANIGLSVLFFKEKYPEAIIYAFEPDRAIYDCLERNVKSWGLTNVHLNNKGVWFKNDTLVFYSDGSLAGSLVVDFSGMCEMSEVQLVPLQDYLCQPISFLKIDIEGAENDLIPHLSDYLCNVKAAFVEYHNIYNRKSKLGEILEVFTQAGFRSYIREAARLTNNPFDYKNDSGFDMQLNVFFYRPKI
jgi:FkbM family methyltransferase